MSLHLPTATPGDVDALDGVGSALRSAGAAVDGARTGLAAGFARSDWTGAAATAGRARGQAEGLVLGALAARLASAAAIVALLQAAVAVEAAELIALERGLRDTLERLADAPGDLVDDLRRASRLGGWEGLPWRGIALPPGGAAAWRDVSGLFRGLDL